jgi:hypothetical protein
MRQSSLPLSLQWSRVWNRTYILGDFIWTAWDYIGETAIGSSSQTGGVDQLVGGHGFVFPWHISYCGDFDLVGNTKPQSIYRQVSKVVLWIGRVVLWIGRVVLWIERVVLWIGRVVLWIERVVLWIGRVVLSHSTPPVCGSYSVYSIYRQVV